MNPLAVGIDLGTTYSVIAALDDQGRPVVIPNAEGHLTTPSVVWLNQGTPVVGEDAKQAQSLGDENVASFFKRWMGNPEYSVTLGDRDWTPVDFSALVLRKLVVDAETFLKRPVTQAVITVPAYFDDHQRRATIAAGQQAGLEVLQIINEPTAAALALGLKLGEQDQLVLVYDLGGGTFDVTLVNITATEFRVLGTDGDHQLGGKDWDDTVAKWFAESFQEKYQIDIFSDVMAFNELRVACEEAKIRLSDVRNTRLTYSYQKQKHSDELTRERFQVLTNHLMERTVALCEHTLADAGKSWGELTGVLLVGGSSRMPQVKEFVQRMSGRPGMQTVNPDHAVAEGAALCAGQRLVKKHSGLTQLYGLPGKRTIQDVTSHTLGVIAESQDQSRFVNSPVLPRNTAIPAQGERDYKVRTQNDGTIECIVYATEGDGTDPRAVAVRGKYVCVGRSTRAGETASIRVQYAYDLNGTIQVSARDLETGIAFAISQEPVGDLSWLEKSPREIDLIDSKSSRIFAPNVQIKTTAAVVTNLLTHPTLNKFGNPEGADLGLAISEEFTGARLLIWSTEPEVQSAIFTSSNPLWAALKEKGFEVQMEQGEFQRRWLRDADQLWIFAGRQAGVGAEAEEAIISFVNERRGLYLAADNEPYLADASRLAMRLFGTRITGDYIGGNIIAVRGHGVTHDDYRRSKAVANAIVNSRDVAERIAVVCKATHYAEEHPLLTGVNFIFEGATISHIEPTSRLQIVLKASDGQILAAVSTDPQQRVVVDCGWTRYFYSGAACFVTETAGTLRYAENIAAYLMGKDDKSTVVKKLSIQRSHA